MIPQQRNRRREFQSIDMARSSPFDDSALNPSSRRKEIVDQRRLKTKVAIRIKVICTELFQGPFELKGQMSSKEGHINSRQFRELSLNGYVIVSFWTTDFEVLMG